MTTNSNTHEYYMKKALQEAHKAFELDEVPVGAIIVIQDKIIARAHNLTQMLNDPTAHAEMQAYTAATEYLGGKYLQDATLYVTLEPCAMCAGAAYWVQIGTIVYGATDNKRGVHTVAKNILHPKTTVVGGVCKDECEAILQDFFKQKRM